MIFNLVQFDVFLLVLVRITAFVYSAPFFSLKSVPQKVKVGFSIFFAFIVFQTLPIVTLNYNGTIDFAAIIIKEALTGLIIGFVTNISYYILAFAGQIIDMEIGFSMINQLDPVSRIQSTITSNFYSYLVMLMILVTNLHHFIIRAFVDTYKLIPIGMADLKPQLYLIMTKFIKDYFVIGFRIVLPTFAATLLLNSILAILAKIAPQMNMFVIGLQLKVLVGLTVLFLVTGFIPSISQFIFDEMMFMMKAAIEALR